MDLNYLLMRRQVSLYRSRHAACIEARRAHLAFADAYAVEISRLRGDAAPL